MQCKKKINGSKKKKINKLIAFNAKYNLLFLTKGEMVTWVCFWQVS